MKYREKLGALVLAHGFSDDGLCWTPIAELLANGDDAYIREKADYVMPIPAIHPLLTPVLAVLPLQLFAYEIAVRRGCDVDQPRNLAKSVTVE